MGIQIFPSVASSKTRYVVTLLSGTSWTVPAGVTYVIAKLFGAGSGGGGGSAAADGARGHPGQVVCNVVATTPAASISYTIGAGGAGAASGGAGSTVGGTTTFTGVTSAVGGNGVAGSGSGAAGTAGTAGEGAENGGQGSALNSSGGAGGQGKIELEYWT